MFCGMCVCVSTCISPAVFGKHKRPDARLSLKWIDANGSLLQSQMPQARTDRQPTSLSLSHPPSLPPTLLSLSHTLSVAQNDLPLWTRVCATGRPLASIYQHWAHPEYCPSFWREANQTNKRTNGERGGGKNKGKKRGTRRKKSDFFCQPLPSGEQMHSQLKWKAQVKKKKKKRRQRIIPYERQQQR